MNVQQLGYEPYMGYLWRVSKWMFNVTSAAEGVNRLAAYSVRTLLMQAMCTVRSDVWSFGVTMWEILTCATRRPYEWLTDQQVLDSCRRRYLGDQDANDEDAMALPVPSDDCPRELYDLMRQCWATMPLHRPTFHEIQMFLARKNDGYRPPQPAPTSPSLPQHAPSTMLCGSPSITDFII